MGICLWQCPFDMICRCSPSCLVISAWTELPVCAMVFSVALVTGPRLRGHQCWPPKKRRRFFWAGLRFLFMGAGFFHGKPPGHCNLRGNPGDPVGDGQPPGRSLNHYDSVTRNCRLSFSQTSKLVHYWGPNSLISFL